jgi:hypothetical protein
MKGILITDPAEFCNPLEKVAEKRRALIGRLSLEHPERVC